MSHANNCDSFVYDESIAVASLHVLIITGEYVKKLVYIYIVSEISIWQIQFDSFERNFMPVGWFFPAFGLPNVPFWKH